MSMGFLRQFQNHVVIRVPQKRTPQKMDFLQMRLPGEVTQIVPGEVNREPHESRETLQPLMNAD
jgi:hypothetical protein